MGSVTVFSSNVSCYSYNPEQHQEVIEDYAKIEIAKQAVKAQKLQEELLTGKMTDTDVGLSLYFISYCTWFGTCSMLIYLLRYLDQRQRSDNVGLRVQLPLLLLVVLLKGTLNPNFLN